MKVEISSRAEKDIDVDNLDFQPIPVRCGLGLPKTINYPAKAGLLYYLVIFGQRF